jgi:hypothetical protein
MLLLDEAYVRCLSRFGTTRNRKPMTYSFVVSTTLGVVIGNQSMTLLFSSSSKVSRVFDTTKIIRIYTFAFEKILRLSFVSSKLCECVSVRMWLAFPPMPPHVCCPCAGWMRRDKSQGTGECACINVTTWTGRPRVANVRFL